MAKTLAQIQEGLSKVYDGPTYQKPDGNTYIPWNEAVKAANEVFGIDGYSIEIVNEPHREADGYAATVRVIVFPSDGASFFRDGEGYNELQVTKNGRELTDTAIKGSASDAANRAFKLFGPRFGLNLYDKGDAQHMSGSKSGGTDTVQQGGGAARGPKNPGDAASESQLNTLRRAGATDEQLAGLTKGEASALIDQVKANGWKMPGAPSRSETTAARVGTPSDDDVDDIFA